MAIGANSYGTVVGVASLVVRYSSGGTFTTLTTPTLAQVERYIDQVSSLLNAILSREGFTIPITQSDSILAMGFFVEEEVASIVEGIHGSGRFGPTTKSPGASRFSLLSQDVQAFVETNAAGFENLGAPRASEASLIGYRGTSDSGNDTFPLFQRDYFGQDGFFENVGTDAS
jgi:hypothetical protein